MTQISYFCCDQAEKATRFDRQQPPSSSFSLRCQGHREHLVGILGILPLLKGSSNIRKSDANVHPEANR